MPTAANAGYYARIVRDRAIRRRLLEAGRRIIQLARESDIDAHGLTERAVREAEAARDAGAGDDVTTPTITEFLDVSAEDDSYDWVIPGLLERGDRLVLTGRKAQAKAPCSANWPCTMAAGIHPFTGDAIPPMRVLLVDCENGAAHTRRKIRPLVIQAASEGSEVREANLWIEVRPEGLDLAADKDVSWLLRRVAALMPDAVMIGPLYRLAPRALNDDSDAAPVIATLNLIRARGPASCSRPTPGTPSATAGGETCAPAVAPRSSAGPSSATASAHPTCLNAKKKRLVDLVPWRGDRDERQWPEHLVAGGTWPWSTHVAGLSDPGDDWSGHDYAAGDTP